MLRVRAPSLASPGSIVVGERTRELLGAAAEVRELGAVQLKGKTATGRIYELMGVAERAPAPGLRTAIPDSVGA